MSGYAKVLEWANASVAQRVADIDWQAELNRWFDAPTQPANNFPGVANARRVHLRAESSQVSATSACKPAGQGVGHDSPRTPSATQGVIAP